MNRRQVLTLGAAGAAWPVVARAQQGERMRRIGLLTGVPETDMDARARNAAFREELQKLGWSEGRNVPLDYRWTLSWPRRNRRLMAHYEAFAFKPS
jgi:putative ABC transport system substrate-binding protein